MVQERRDHSRITRCNSAECFKHSALPRICQGWSVEREERIDCGFSRVDGYLLLGPNRALLTSAIDGRASGQTLPRSDSFRAQLPLDTHTYFSAVAFYNLASAVGPLVDQLNATGLLTPDQQKRISTLTANRQPTLVYAYGSPDQILVGSRNSIAGLGLDALSSLGLGETIAPLMGTLTLAPQ